jgi:hypothetical protein
MGTTTVPAPTSLLRLGHARVDVTPPVGIYHRMWGAAGHDRATGVHRPLVADVLALGPLGADRPRLVRAHADLVGLVQRQHDALVAAGRYGKGLYQEEPSILAPGCLEALTDAVAARMARLLDS